MTDQIEVPSKRRIRASYTPDFRRQAVAECLVKGTSVAGVALRRPCACSAGGCAAAIHQCVFALSLSLSPLVLSDSLLSNVRVVILRLLFAFVCSGSRSQEAP